MSGCTVCDHGALRYGRQALLPPPDPLVSAGWTDISSIPTAVPPASFRDVGANLNGHVWALEDVPGVAYNNIYFLKDGTWTAYGGIQGVVSGG